jgi:hypothetical protein
MRERHETIRFGLYSVVFLFAAWASLVGFSRFVMHMDEISNRTWVPETQVTQLMQHHGTEVLKITQDKVYIMRDARWIPVLKRNQT